MRALASCSQRDPLLSNRLLCLVYCLGKYVARAVGWEQVVRSTRSSYSASASTPASALSLSRKR